VPVQQPLKDLMKFSSGVETGDASEGAKIGTYPECISRSECHHRSFLHHNPTHPAQHVKRSQYVLFLHEHLHIHGMLPWTLISPASRGIGFALAKRVLQTTNAPVVVTARNDLDKVKEELLGDGKLDESRLKVLRLDVLGAIQFILYTLKTVDSLPRRIHHRRRSSRMQEVLYPQLSPTPARIHRTRHTLPREIASADQR
jgi:hypothetical protein